MTNPFGDLNIESILLGSKVPVRFAVGRYLLARRAENGNSEPELSPKGAAILASSVENGDLDKRIALYNDLKFTFESKGVDNDLLSYGATKIPLQNGHYEDSNNSIGQYKRVEHLLEQYENFENFFGANHGEGDVDPDFLFMLALLAGKAEYASTDWVRTRDMALDAVHNNHKVIDGFTGYYDVDDRIDALSAYLALEKGKITSEELDVIVPVLHEYLLETDAEFAEKPNKERFEPLVAGLYMVAGLDRPVAEAFETLAQADSQEYFAELDIIQRSYVAGSKGFDEISTYLNTGAIEITNQEVNPPLFAGSGYSMDQMISELRRYC